MKKNISNWSNYPIANCEEVAFDHVDAIRPFIKNGMPSIARGNGRCYGDASLGNRVISTLHYDKILSFDAVTGVITCQAGITFDVLLDIIVPRGWFLPVTPGTKFITLGGAVASDVHGKNHHKEGSFSAHIHTMQILCGDGQLLSCGPNENTDLFHATCGGMGLTGVIISVRFQLKKIETSYIRQKQIKARNLDEALELFEQYRDTTYSVAWIDCLQKGDKQGRSILNIGEHAEFRDVVELKSPLHSGSKKKLTIPFNFPGFALNPLSIKAFNLLYYHKNIHKIQENITHYEPFFYPLDSILHWNRMYGTKGFVQYQFVLPLHTSREGLKLILDQIAEKNMGSFLAVLKLFGKQDDLISFPMEGYTLALDFPIKKGLFEFLDILDELVLAHEGRLYMSKDARMKPQVLAAGYDRLDEFKEIIQKYNPSQSIHSKLAERLAL